MRYDDPALRRHLAAAYSLGSLSTRARARFERLLADDAELQAMVDDAHLRLAPLALTLVPVAPDARVWKGIDQRLGFTPPKQRMGWFGRLLRPALGWAATGIVIGFIGGQLAPGLVGEVATTPVGVAGTARLPPSYVGVLSDDAGGAGLLVSSLRHGRSADFKFVKPSQPPEGQVFFLWGLPADGGTPVAIGPLPAGSQGSIALEASAESLLSEVSRLGVTLEAAGQSPLRPNLPYRYLGFCGKFWP